jgi:flagellar motor switch protein FliG
MSSTEKEILNSASRQDLNKKPAEQGMRINGMQQVVDLLRHADPAFRESLLKRLNQRDPELVQNLRKIFR